MSVDEIVTAIQGLRKRDGLRTRDTIYRRLRKIEGIKREHGDVAVFVLHRLRWTEVVVEHPPLFEDCQFLSVGHVNPTWLSVPRTSAR